jgi:HAD superfamily hydrolase (TIGR01509 family)
VPTTVLIFDFDGLLMDTESTMLASWQYEWRQHQLELAAEGFFVEHGGDVSEQRYARLASAVGPGYDRAASHARRVAHRDELNAALDLAPGIRAWLDQAGELGLRLAVASSSPRAWVARLLEQVGQLNRFERVVCGDEVERVKPDPGVYLLALAQLGVPPEQAVAFEDSPHGVAAAKAAGLRCVAVPNRHTDPATFGAADLLLSSAEDLPIEGILGAWGGRGTR